MIRKLGKRRDIAIILCAILLGALIFYAPKVYTQYTVHEDLKKALGEVAAAIQPTGFIEQKSINRHQTTDFYGGKRILLPEVANYYNDPSIQIESVVLKLTNLGWTGAYDSPYFCMSHPQKTKTLVCIDKHDELEEGDLMGGSDTVYVGHDNYVKVKAPFNFKISTARED